jgi:hypothetical protein
MTTLQDMTVTDRAIEHGGGGDSRCVAEQKTPKFSR